MCSTLSASVNLHLNASRLIVVTISKLLVHIFSAFPFLHINYGPVLSVCVCVSVSTS